MQPEQIDMALLFKNIIKFRTIRDQLRFHQLAQIFKLAEPQDTNPSLEEIEALINLFAGKSFGNLEANQFVTQEIRGLLDDLGFKILCPKVVCQKPATLLCAKGKRMPNGAFSFIHPCGKRQKHHGGLAKLPYLRLISVKKNWRTKHEARTE